MGKNNELPSESDVIAKFRKICDELDLPCKEVPRPEKIADLKIATYIPEEDAVWYDPSDWIELTKIFREMGKSFDWKDEMEKSLKHEKIHRDDIKDGLDFKRENQRLLSEYHAYKIGKRADEVEKYAASEEMAELSKKPKSERSLSLRSLSIISIFPDNVLKENFIPRKAEHYLKLKNISGKIESMNEIWKYSEEVEKILRELGINLEVG